MRGTTTDVRGPRDRDTQPISAVEWVHPDTLKANGWNPNNVFRPEKKLLKVSLLESGWTAAIVVGHDDEIIDGYHRWSLAKEDKDVQEMTGGLVPIVRSYHSDDPVARRMETVRQNRARGVHHVVKMADLVAELRDLGVDNQDIAVRLGMDPEEVTRLLDRGSMVKRGSDDDFGDAWAPDREADKETQARIAALHEAEEAERRKERKQTHEIKTQ